MPEPLWKVRAEADVERVLTKRRLGLAAFVLDRIAEDEELWQSDPHRLSPRMLRECELKREIVSLFLDAESTSVHTDTWVTMREAVRNLAAAYSDHPDYNEDWKPIV